MKQNLEDEHQTCVIFLAKYTIYSEICSHYLCHYECMFVGIL